MRALARPCRSVPCPSRPCRARGSSAEGGTGRWVGALKGKHRERVRARVVRAQGSGSESRGVDKGRQGSGEGITEGTAQATRPARVRGGVAADQADLGRLRHDVSAQGHLDATGRRGRRRWSCRRRQPGCPWWWSCACHARGGSGGRPSPGGRAICCDGCRSAAERCATRVRFVLRGEPVTCRHRRR